MSGSTVLSTVEAVAIGNFDGMHRGHQALFSRLGRDGGIVVIEHFRATLTPGIYRADFTRYPLFFYDFEKIRDLAAEDFVAKLRADFPKLRNIVVGEDFAFGAGRSADTKDLRRLFGEEVTVVPEVTLEGEPVHSRFIRDLIRRCEIPRANAMLGHPYTVWGDVIAGQGIGKASLVPTINLDTGRFLLPGAGVYRSETCVDGVWFPSVTFVGHRHTADGNFAVESHVIGEDLHGRRIQEAGIRWYAKLRDNRKFESFEALKRQIVKDIEMAQVDERETRDGL